MHLPYNYIVRNFINQYLSGRWSPLRNVLALSKYYFPIIEEELHAAGLPLELRYLPIIESNLSIRATSRMGAVGLWQFMPATGKNLGLEINSLVDERCDVLKSTRAACKFLAYLYKVYGDWTLAIAAYNCGPGNVNRAIARAGANCKTYWDIYDFLPRETRGYVPKFIAAAYAYTYHEAHNITAAATPDCINTDTVMVHRVMHLGQVASTLNIPIETLRDLNPQYKLDIIPATKKSYSLRLPTRYTSEFVQNEKEIYSKDSLYLKEYINPANLEKKRAEGVGYIYTVRSGDNLGLIAKRNRCTVKELMKWNKLNSTVIRPGQKLRIEKPKPRA
jgi:membrane-bound lytic murein transglycosylase D